jgi:hypothetical protein
MSNRIMSGARNTEQRRGSVNGDGGGGDGDGSREQRRGSGTNRPNTGVMRPNNGVMRANNGVTQRRKSQAETAAIGTPPRPHTARVAPSSPPSPSPSSRSRIRPHFTTPELARQYVAL